MLFGCLSLLAALAIYFVPETRGMELTETIEELEGYVQQQSQQQQQQQQQAESPTPLDELIL